jgi:hypothetical protein
MAIINRRLVVTQFLRIKRHDLGWGRLLFRPPLPRLLIAEGLFPIQFLLWELVLADVAEAKFVEFRPRRVQLMQSIHHVVMPALKSSINPGRLQYH